MKNPINKKTRLSVKLSISGFIFLFCLFGGVNNNASAQFAVPSCNSATLNGNIVTNGTDTTVWFEWGPGSSITFSTPQQTFSTDSDYSQVINGLQENSTYSYRAMASNQNGTSTGSTISFTTPPCGQNPPPPAANPFATITSTPSCTSPCNVAVSWTSSNVANPPNVIQIYKDGISLWTDTGNISKSNIDFSVSAGSHTYCIRADKSDWSITGDLNCSTTTVNAVVVNPPPPPPAANPFATITSTPSCTSPCNVAVSWTSSSVANPPNVIQIYRDGFSLWTDTGNTSGSNIDFGEVTGSHTYCIRADNSDFSITGNLACSTTNVNAQSVNPPPPPPAATMSGTLTPSTSSCTIPAGQNSCNISFSWNTINPVASSAVTKSGNVTVIFGNSGNNVFFTVKFNSETFFLYNNAVLLAQSTVFSSCASGTTWNGNVCQTNSITPTPTCQDPAANNFGGTLPCTYPPQLCQDPNANNFHQPIPCTYPAPTCQDPNATNFRGALPCRYPAPTCQDPAANNFGGALPCTYPAPTCQDPSALNFHGALPCRYQGATCQDPSANNFGKTLPCTYPPQLCQDPNANNFHQPIPCTYPAPTCQDPNASNFHGTLPCTYPPQVCQDTSAINFHGTLPCRYAQNNNPATNTNNNTNNNNPIININVPSGGTGLIQTCQDVNANNYGGILPCTYFTQICQDYNAINYHSALPCRYGNFLSGQPIINYPVNNYSLAPVTTPTPITQITSGSTLPLRITPAQSAVIRNVTVTNQGRGSNPLVTLSIDGGSDVISLNETRSYHVTWKNQSGQILRKVVLRVLLPASMDFVNATYGSYTKSDNTLTYEIGTLNPADGGELFVTATTNNLLKTGELVVVIADLVYTDTSNLQGSAIAYATHHANSSQFGLGANVFGSGVFFPDNLFGWLLLIVLILILVLLVRYLYGDVKEPKPAQPL